MTGLLDVRAEPYFPWAEPPHTQRRKSSRAAALGFHSALPAQSAAALCAAPFPTDTHVPAWDGAWPSRHPEVSLRLVERSDLIGPIGQILSPRSSLLAPRPTPDSLSLRDTGAAPVLEQGRAALPTSPRPTCLRAPGDPSAWRRPGAASRLCGSLWHSRCLCSVMPVKNHQNLRL